MGVQKKIDHGREVTQIGNSYMVSIPMDSCRELGLDEQASVDVEVDYEAETVTYHL
ncbi:AbrB/MazE/SpoVT family DNA-binding domain-containing protein [Natronomonas marina]|uniref:AbrB/MazE/SpoVT family DNA-binding domain-containing protein n=1 Tax=Natronomonas marina TaxID=2961939 RepID=UPI0020CA1F32|nr:AbrB/MazE/SpoVT family DNA-binding domain-containing protein [Natronomonas marina]